MTKLVWDATGDRLYETGISQGVLYPVDPADGSYETGVPWNGLTGVTESPSGAESTPLYADNTKYLNLTSNEEFGATIEAYTYPEEFAVCDGSAELSETVAGVFAGQQGRQPFGLVYVTQVGNDVLGTDYGKKYHLIYGAKAAPSERAYATVNDSPEAITFSWEVTTVPVTVTGFKPTAQIVIDGTKLTAPQLAELEDTLFGDASTGAATLPLPDALVSLLEAVPPPSQG